MSTDMERGRGGGEGGEGVETPTCPVCWHKIAKGLVSGSQYHELLCGVGVSYILVCQQIGREGRGGGEGRRGEGRGRDSLLARKFKIPRVLSRIVGVPE